MQTITGTQIDIQKIEAQARRARAEFLRACLRSLFARRPAAAPVAPVAPTRAAA